MENELEELGEQIAEQAAHLDAAMHRLLTDLRAFDLRGGWHTQGAVSCAHWLAWRVGWDLVTARAHVRVARKLAEFPSIDDALRCGEVSYSKVRAMLRVATPANEMLLLEHAKLMTASQLEELCRRYALVQRQGQDAHPRVDEQRRHVRRRDTEDGMVKIEAVLHPEEAEMVWAMLNRVAVELAHEPSSGPCGDSAGISDAAPRPHATITASPSGPVVMDGSDIVAPANLSRLDDSAESLEEASPAPRRDMGLVGSGSVATAPDGRQDPAGRLDDSAESLEEASPAPRRDVGLVGPGSVVTAPDGRQDAAAREIRDAVVVPANLFRLDDSAESVPGTSPSPRRDVGLRRLDDSAESHPVESCGSASMQALSDVPPRSLLDRLLDDAEALRGADAAGHGGAPDPSDAERGSGAVAESVRCRSNAAGTRREADPLRDRAAAARRAFNRADALVAVAQGYLRGSRPERSPVEVVLTVPASSLRAGAAIDPLEAGEMGESFVSSETARRLSCDAGVVEVVQDEQGVPLSAGRRRRTIGGALKRALRKRDEMCSFPGCTNRIFLEGHHIQHWADGGETSLRNTALLCSSHHRYVHEYGYTVELGPDQRPRFRDPHGRCVAAVPERPRVAELGWPQIRAANEALQIDADTIAGPWDGTPVDYGRIVGHLAVAEGLA